MNERIVFRVIEKLSLNPVMPHTKGVALNIDFKHLSVCWTHLMQ